MPDVMTMGRTTQFGPETIPGTAPGAGATKQLTDLTVTLDPSFAVTAVRGTGRRFDASQNPDGQESVTGTLAGRLGYNSILYPACMIWGTPTPTTPTGGVNARQWVFKPPLTGTIPPQTFDIEMGDANDAEQTLYSLLTDFGIDLTRANTTPSGKLLARALTKAAPGTAFTGMTSVGVTTVPIVPVLPKQWSAWMDDLPANIGVTQLTRCFHAGFTYASAYMPFYPLNASLTSYGGVADDQAVKTTALLELMKDAVGEGLWLQARAGLKKYIRYKATSAQFVDNYQTLAITGTATSGTFTLTYKGQTATIQWNSSAAAAQTALTALTTIGAGNLTATGGPLPGTPIVLTWTGSLANDTTGVAIGTNSLAGTTPVPTVLATTIPYSITIDYCGEVNKPGPQADAQGLRVRQWDFTVTEDPTWNAGQGVIITVVNALAAL